MAQRKRSAIIERLETRALLSTVATTPVAAQLQSAIQFAQGQLTTTATADLSNNPAAYIDYTNSNGTWDVTNSGSWSAGAWPAELWEMYALTGNASWKAEAQSWSTNLISEDTQTSDDYLRIYDPFIYAWQDSSDPQAAAAIVASAQARVSTFNAAVGAWSEPWRASSSGNPAANFGVLLDQTMDTQEVFWAAAYTGNTTLYNDAVDEMTTAEKCLVRPDGSTAQFAYFNATSGAFIDNETYAGYSASSTWSRGQAWAIDSFANAYAQTGRPDFLATDESLANYYISHVPSDWVPYWDYDDPAIPNANRDTSAAAIAATGLLQLAQIEPNAANAQKYYHAAESILSSLCSNYLASGTSSHGILTQGDDLNSGVNDASLVWGDYYFLKAADLYLNRNLTSLSISPAGPTLTVGQTADLSATGLDQYGNTMPSTPVTWSASGGTIDSSGVFSPPDAAGSYTVTATSGSITGSDTIKVIAAGGSVAGTVAGGAGGETVYLDANNNAVLDATELSTTTTATGAYSFSGVPAGAYIVRQVLPAGTTQIAPANGYGLHISVVAGGALTGENFVDGTLAVGGSINGLVVGGLAGEVIYLDANNNGILDSNELRTTTSSTGAYSFSSVPAGAYIVRQVLSAGTTQLAPANGYGLHISVVAGAALTGENFIDGTLAVGGSINGLVVGGLAGEVIYLDANNNGILDSNELSITTNSTGAYSFSNVPAGAYIIRQVLPTGYAQTSPASNYGLHITVAAGAALVNENFADKAIATTGSISGTVTAGEPGETIYLDANNNSTLDSNEFSTTTSPAGSYSFSNIPAGQYIVRQVLPNGYAQTSPSNDYGLHITVVAGNALTNENFTDKTVAVDNLLNDSADNVLLVVD